MTNKLLKILNNTPNKEIDEFYCYMWGELCSKNAQDEKEHIIKYLKQFLIDRRIFLRFNKREKWIHSTIKANIILSWLYEMNEIYCKEDDDATHNN